MVFEKIRRQATYVLIIMMLMLPISLIQPVMSSCNVTVAAHDNAIGSDIEISFQVDGNSYITPHVVLLGLGNHSFSFPEKDSYGYPFKHCYIWYPDGSYQYIETRIFKILITSLNNTDFTLKAYYHREPYSCSHPTVIYIDIPRSYIGVGQNFSINIVVHNVKDLFLWELVAYYPRNIMKGLNIVDTMFLHRIEGAPWIFLVDGYDINGYCTWPPLYFGGNFTPYNEYSEEYGRVHCCSSIIGDYPGVDGTGIIVTITFKKITEGKISLLIVQNEFLYTFICNSSIVEIPYTVTVLGDVSGPQMGIPDGIVDARDIAIVCRKFGVNEEKAYWDSFYDLTGPRYLSHDCIIDARDIALICSRFGQKI
ncbi:MAG: hypothetical protein QXJ62_05830 [Nitrososphaeria archaeon]